MPLRSAASTMASQRRATVAPGDGRREAGAPRAATVEEGGNLGGGAVRPAEGHLHVVLRRVERVAGDGEVEADLDFRERAPAAACGSTCRTHQEAAAGEE